MLPAKTVKNAEIFRVNVKFREKAHNFAGRNIRDSNEERIYVIFFDTLIDVRMFVILWFVC